MIDHNSEEENNAILKILSDKELEHFMKRDGAHDKEQFITTIIDILCTIYRNPDIPELHNVRVPDINRDTILYYRNKDWHAAHISEFTHAFFSNLIMVCKGIQKPLEYYMSLDNAEEILYNEDPLRLMKHLDAFINGDEGYGWGDAKLVTKKEMTERIKLTLMVPV